MNDTSPANGASVAAAAVGVTVVSTSGPAAAVGTTAVAAAVGTDGVAVEHAPNTRLNATAKGKTRRIDKRCMNFSQLLPMEMSAHHNACTMEFQDSAEAQPIMRHASPS
jgi:hypothetical protein